MSDSSNVPRRARLDLWTKAERAIYDAVQEVEGVGADVRLTDAVVLLQAARDSVADYVDGVNKRRYVSLEAAPTAPPVYVRCICNHPGDTLSCPIDHDQIQHVRHTTTPAASEGDGDK